MRALISWSGSLSRQIAESLTKYLPLFISDLEPFFSPEGIAKGDRWWEKLSTILQESNLGIFCITPDNYEKPWLLFEAGAISGKIGDSRVIPIYFGGIKPTNITGPFSSFQGATFSKTEMFNVVQAIHKSGSSVPSARLEKLFEAFWDELESEILGIIENFPDESINKIPTRSDSDLLHEILEIVRNLKEISTIDQIDTNLIARTQQQLAFLLDSEYRKSTGYVETKGSFLERTHNLYQFVNLASNECLRMLPGVPIYSSPAQDSSDLALPSMYLESNKDYFISLLENLAELFKLVAPIGTKVWTSLRDRRADNFYHTFARAGVYSPIRETTSRPIHNDSNIILRLKENYKNDCCVLLTGSEHGPQVWETGDNDRLGEDKSVMLGAIVTETWDVINNCWGNNELVWILGVSADKENAFTPVHIDLMQTCVVAFSIIANIIARQNDTKN